jgi:RNA polymerase sigma-70 factor (ECF subfamily)
VLITREANSIKMATTIQVMDDKAFADLYERYSAVLYGALYKVLKNKEQTEDALQNTFIKVWLHRNSYDIARGTQFTWMLNIARNEALDMLRSKHHRNTRKTFSLDIHQSVASGNPFAHLDHLDISKLLFILKPKDRAILELCFFRGYTCEETARTLQIPCGTIKTRMQHSYKVLRAVLVEPAVASKSFKKILLVSS